LVFQYCHDEDEDEEKKEEEEDFRIDSKVRCEGAHPLCGALSWRRLTKLS